MKLQKEDKTINIEPEKDKFILSSHRQFLNDSPHTIKAIAKLYSKGFREGYIDFKAIVLYVIIGIIIIAFCIF